MPWLFYCCLLKTVHVMLQFAYGFLVTLIENQDIPDKKKLHHSDFLLSSPLNAKNANSSARIVSID